MPSTFVQGISDPFEIVPPAPGRRKPPIPGKPPTMYARIQGGLVQFQTRGLPSAPPPSQVGRVIGHWSLASRLNILRYINTIAWDRIGRSCFITLTYPDVIDSLHYANRSKHRYVFLRYIEKHLGRHVACLWRAEWEVRKSGIYKGFLRPHFHLCLMNVPFLSPLRVRHWWMHCIRYGNRNLQVNVKPIQGIYGCLLYIAKYVSKLSTLDIPLHRNNEINFGRHWGTTRKELIPMCEVSTIRKLSADEMEWVTAWGQENIVDYHAELGNGFTLLGRDHAKFWERALDLS